MQRRATILIVAALAVFAYVGRDSVILPLLDRLQSNDSEIAGCVRLEEGQQTIGLDEPVTLVDGAMQHEPVHGTIERNSTLFDELRDVGVSAFDIDTMTKETRQSFDWRKIRAGQSFDVFMTAAGDLDSLLLYTSPQDYVRVRYDDTGDHFVARVCQVPYKTEYRITHGTIENSIFASLDDQGAETSLATSLDDIFGWTIDFAKDLQRGDEYVMLYEVRTYETGHSVVGDVLAARVVNEGKEYDAVRFTPADGQVGYYNVDGSSMQKAMRRAPLKFTHITSAFSRRRFHPIEKVYKPHFGTDYGAPIGTPIYATGDGLVVAANYQTGNGNYVKIRHTRNYETYYLHMAGFAKGIRSGTRVSEGQCIGYVGQTGYATGPHVCYRIMKNGQWVNPKALDLPARDPIKAADIVRFNNVRDAYMSSIAAAITDGADNRTVAVDTPRRPTAALKASMF
ncbi:MAG TPA: peptidoglycan DD-metalloendopeptidase family protein [Candidatus Krumholzibacteria bacterium]|nr:peptidoglycan DD-metalloendopeptidase family protein [Candidatus Krumholzibacteria bacterium]